MIFVLAARCPTLDPPESGNVSVTGHSIGDTAIYSCNDGYDLVGTPERTCERVADDRAGWSGMAPFCQRRFLLYVTMHVQP